MSSKLEKQGNKWTFRYYENGKQKRKTVEAFSHQQAKDLQLEFLHKNTTGAKKLFNITLQAYLKEYLNYSETNKRPNSYRKDKYTIDNILNLTKINLLKDITPKHIEEYKTHRSKKIKPISVNRELQSVKAIFNKAVEWKYLQESPTKSVKYIKQPIRPPRFLNEEEVKNLLKTATGFYKDMIIIALYTGFRISEVYYLQWQDVDFDKNLISVNPKHDFTPKDYEFRSIPINANLKGYLLKIKPASAKNNDYIMPSRKPINTIFTAIPKIFKKAGIKNASFHTLRHTFASHLVINGISLYTVSQLLGHSKIETTMIYAHLSKDHLKNSVDSLNFSLKI
ncbi:MAG: tyrosine-type recombinase/integrase [Endomicrobium sp.]|jgi:site-specific recombinase XerD|nr:tyrosine-type recombinase/integrase [Endomicrobium sp.]